MPPVLDARVDVNGKFAFVEFCSEEVRHIYISLHRPICRSIYLYIYIYIYICSTRASTSTASLRSSNFAPRRCEGKHAHLYIHKDLYINPYVDVSMRLHLYIHVRCIYLSFFCLSLMSYTRTQKSRAQSEKQYLHICLCIYMGSSHSSSSAG